MKVVFLLYIFRVGVIGNFVDLCSTCSCHVVRASLAGEQEYTREPLSLYGISLFH